MIKKYAIAIDSSIPTLDNQNLRMFYFGENTIFDTIEKAERRVAEILITKPEGDKTILTILPIYVKN
jgi:hypothetical protein